MFGKSQAIGLFLGFRVAFMALSVSIFNWYFTYWHVLVSVLHLRVQLYTRNCFVLTALGWIFQSQFLGVFQLAHIPKFSRLLKIPISCFRGFYSTFYALKLKITSHAFGRSRDWLHSIGCHSRRVCGFYVDIRSQYTFCISKHRQFSLYSFSIVLTLSTEIQE